MANDGKLERMDVDYSSTVDEKLPQCEKLATEGKLEDAIDTLLSLEKQTRTGSDTHSTGRILVGIVKMCREHRKWDLLNENIVLLTKRRGQIKQAVTKMIQEVCTYLDDTPTMEVKLKLIDTLRTVTAGKIYVEIERARLTRTLAKIKEDQGDTTAAAKIMQELQVETYGSMDKREKVEFILEQMRLCLLTKDYIRTQIISKKISIKYFEEEKTSDLKLKFYQLMIELDQQNTEYLSICKHFKAICNTQDIKDDPQKHTEVLRCIVLYLILAPYDNEQSDMMHHLKVDKSLELVPKYKELLELFTTSEIINYQQVVKDYESVIRDQSLNDESSAIFNPNTEAGTKRWADLKIRVVESNIRVMAKYYTRVQMDRMAQLLDLTSPECEEFLSKLVVNGTVTAKIDRLARVIDFRKASNPNDILNDWCHNINSLMKLVNKTTHLITKEEMVHKAIAQ